MAQWAKDEDEIDVLVFAMRRIFGFDYWLGENNGEFGVSFHYHGQDFVRSPLPAAEELQKNMFRLDACFRLNLSGAPENAPDHVLEGEYLDEEGESQLDVFWIMETDDARQAFKRDRSALRQIGERTKMLRFILEDECALGHVFAMLHAILEHRDGLLVIPDDRGNIILERRQALEFLNREIRED